MNDEIGTNDGVKQRFEAESTTPEVRVGTSYCEGYICKLEDPGGGDLRVSAPFMVNIVNRRSCQGYEPTVRWRVRWTQGSASGELGPGETHSHTMNDQEEALDLYYGECEPFEEGRDDVPEPGTTPRVTINLIKVGNL